MCSKKSQGFKSIIAVICSIIIIFSVIGMAFLGIGVKNADKTGTFNLFGKSYHIMQADDMSPVIDMNDMIVVKHCSPTSFKRGDLIAFYYEQFEDEHILIRRLSDIDGMEYTLTDEKGNKMLVSAEKTRFLGIVDSRSAALGKMVSNLQAEGGKSVFLWWSLGILFFVAGVTMLLHVIIKNKNSEPDGFDFDSVEFDE